MVVSEIKLYEILRIKLGEKEAEALVDFVDTKLKERDEENAKVLATKADVAEAKADLIKWMFIFWIGQVAAMLAIVLMFLKK